MSLPCLTVDDLTKMTLCSNLAQSLFGAAASGSSTSLLHLIDAKTVLAETSVMFVDLTQLFHMPTGLLQSSCEQRTVEFETIDDLLTDSGPLGTVTCHETTGRLTNIIDVFSAETAAALLVQRIQDILSGWSANCEVRRVTSRLNTIFLVVDGDSCMAKSEERKKRINSSPASGMMRRLEKFARPRLTRTEEEISALFHGMKDRLFKTDREEKMSVEYLVGSLQRYICQRTHRSEILASFTDCLRRNGNMETTVYIVRGRENAASNESSSSSHVTRVCGHYIHPLPCPGDMPYNEADSVIPYLWSNVRDHEQGACIYTTDSDMIVTLLSMLDKRVFLLGKLGGKLFSDKMDHVVVNKRVAFSARCSLGSDRRKHLDTLLHLTMGGCDYAENFYRCGAAKLMERLDKMMYQPHSQFECVRFVRRDDTEEELFFHHQSLKVGSSDWCAMREMVLSNDNLFPVRLMDRVYIVELKGTSAALTYGWYNNLRGLNRSLVNKIGTAKTTSVEKSMERKLTTAMRRRLFSLSLVTECRTRMDTDMMWNCHVARKCGYDFDNQFAYL